MNTNTNNTVSSSVAQTVSGIVIKLTQTARRKAVVMAAATVVVAGTLGIARPAAAFVADATAVSTTLLGGIPSEVDNVPGGATYSNSTVYGNSANYNMHYAGEDLRVDQINAANGIWQATGTANVVVRRFNGPTTDIVWYRGTGTPGTTNQYLDAGQVNGFTDAFSGNNLLVGTDNLFANQGDTAGNDTNVERLDTIWNAGFKSSSTTAFTIFDRGETGQHDAFKVAAITGLDTVTGKPTSYGPMMSFSEGSWGNTDVVGEEHYVVTHRDYTVAGDPWHPSNSVDQSIGGTVIPTADLASAGTTIYGYSLFAADTHFTGSGSGSQLDNWMNTTDYPSGTNNATNGGLDAIGTAAVLYSTVPEPAAGAIMVGGLSAILMMRRRPTIARTA